MPESITKKIVVPDHLVYEMDEGKAIYYHGYQDVLNQTKTSEQIMGSSVLQSLIIELIKDYLKPLFGKEYVILSSEIGLQFSKKSWRSADIAVFLKKELLASHIKNNYASIPPVLVIEVDTKAALQDIPHPEQYYHRKTDQLLDFGVKQVLWIFTSTEKFMLAEQKKRWETGNWVEDLILHSDITLNIHNLIQEFTAENRK